MFICSATLRNDYFGETVYKIVTEPQEADMSATDDNIAKVHLSTPIADVLMKAIVYNNSEFECNNQTWQIVRYAINSEFPKYCPYKYKKKSTGKTQRIDFSSPESEPKIYIYNVKSICPHCYNYYGIDDSAENVIAKIPVLSDPDTTVSVNINYCSRCKRYFTNKYSLEMYERKYGVLLFQRIIENYSKDGNLVRNYEFADDSILSRYGYTVRAGQLTDKQRQSILVYLIESKKASKQYIKNKLSEFISARERCYHSERYINAINLWKKDIFFVDEYNIDKQTDIGKSKLYWVSAPNEK